MFTDCLRLSADPLGINWSLSCSWSVAECKKYRVIARRPLWADVAIPRYNEKIRCAGMSKVCPKMYLFCGISVYRHFTGRLPRRFAPRNDMVVVTRLRRFQQSDKLKFAYHLQEHGCGDSAAVFTMSWKSMYRKSVYIIMNNIGYGNHFSQEFSTFSTGFSTG